MSRRPRGRLKQLLELLDAEAGVGHDPAHGIGVDGVAAWDGKKPVPVGHHHMLAAFASDPKSSPSEGTDGPAVVDARRASLIGHFDFPKILADKCLCNGGLVFRDGITDVADRLGLGRALGPASR